MAASFTYITYSGRRMLSASAPRFNYLNSLRTYKPELLSRLDVHGYFQLIVDAFTEAHPDLEGEAQPLDPEQAAAALQAFYLFMGLGRSKRWRQKLERKVHKYANRQYFTIMNEPGLVFPSLSVLSH
ncbi:MAG: hypothetical protein ACJ73N_14490 [Bryobacteraceae bacterium]